MIITKVYTEGLLSQLVEEVVDSYDDSKVITDLIDDLFDFQHRVVPITKGTIAPSVTRTVTAENKSLLAVLMTLHDSVGGYISVDTDRKLQWPDNIGKDKGQQIRYKKNLRGITKDINYRDLCTRLIPLGAGKLSDIYISDEDADMSEDVTYGYLTLISQYACYIGWTGAGDALPNGLEVSSGEVWVTASSHSASADWKNPTRAYDGNVGTASYFDKIYSDWSDTFELTFSATNSSKMRCYLTKRSAPETISKVLIEAYWGGAYHDVFEANYPRAEWFEVSWSAQNVTKLRFSFWNTTSSRGLPQIMEADLFNDDNDESGVWVQGADERTLRCNIGNYDSGKDYHVSYTHADYIKAWDRIAAGDEIISKVLTNKYEESSESMLEAARLLMDEIKIAPVSYLVSAVDLSESEELDWDFEAIQLGSIIHIIDEELGISVSVRAIKIVHLDLLHPEELEIEFSNRTRDLSDTIINIYKELG